MLIAFLSDVGGDLILKRAYLETSCEIGSGPRLSTRTWYGHNLLMQEDEDMMQLTRDLYIRHS